MFKGRKSETQVQYSMETRTERWINEYKRARGKMFSYIWNRIKWNYFPKWGILPNFPLNIDIESSSACNLKCDHCFRQYMDMRENAHMDWDVFTKIADECGKHGLFTMKFSMRGEPTLHPKLPEMVAYLKKVGVKEVWINTHGGNLTEEFTRKLLAAKPDWITVSFDGLGEMYESIRKPLKYDESLERLKRLRRIRDELSPKTFLNTQGLWSAIKHDPDEFYNTMRPIVDRVCYNPDMNFKEIMLVPDPDFVCPRLWQRLAITSNGDVLKCPSDFEKDEVMANVKTKTIKEIWEDEQEKNRQLHLAGRKNESIACYKCHHGAKKVPRTVQVDGHTVEGTDYEYKKEFEGVGLNRPENQKQTETISQ